MCSRHLAPLSGIIHTFWATHSEHHTLLNSYKMVRSPHLCSHPLQYRRLMILLLQVLCPAHCYHAVQSAHKSLRVPPVMAQVMSCRLMKRSRSSHSLSSYSAAVVSIAPPQPSQPPVPISLLDAAVQTTSTQYVTSLRRLSTQTSDQQDTSLSL